MPVSQSLLIDLPEDLARFVDRKVTSGEYPNGQELVLGLLRDWEGESEADTDWLRTQIGPALAALDADPSSAVPLAEAFKRLRHRRGKAA